MTVLPFDREGHARVQSLLPWYVNGRLEDHERAAVDAHLARCPRCRADLEAERRLHAGLVAAAPTPPAAPPGSRLHRTLDSLSPAAPAGRWRWLLALQSGLLLVLSVAVVALWWRGPAAEPAPYRAQGAAPGPGGANAVVMFDPMATETQIRQALAACDARFAGGPTTTRAYLLALPAADAATLARLRRQPGVALAESLAVGEAR